MASAKQKKFVAKLKKEDPEFYATLIASKDLLNIKEGSDSEDSADDSSEEGLPTDAADTTDKGQDDWDDIEEEDLYADEDVVPEKKSKKKKQSKPDSDEENYDDSMSDGEGDEPELPERTTQGNRTIITPKLVKEWRQQLQSNNPEEAFKNVSSGLLAAIESLNSSDETSNSKFCVKSPSIFNQLVHVSLQHMAPALLQMLRITDLAHMTASRTFRKYAVLIKAYLQNVLKLHDCITEPTLKEAILRRGMLPLITVYKVKPKQCRQFIRKLVDIWAAGYSNTRVTAFLAIYRLVKMMGEDILDYALMSMYISYVKKCSNTYPGSLGFICFMRLSLCELYSMNQGLAYRHAFVYIRQMACHLRNATITNKREKLQLVYNWQFIHCLHLWCSLLSSTHPSKVLEPLVYPVVQLALGTMNLQKTPRFFPLVLRICSMLSDLSAATGTFIPVLPFLINMFSEIKESKKKIKKEDKECRPDLEKTPNWNCALKLSEGEVGVPSIMRSLMHECALEMSRYLTVEAHTVAFPELVVPAIIALKKCEKMTKNAQGQSLVRQLLDHISQQASVVETRRQTITFQLKDQVALQDWENALKQEGKLPIVELYEKLRSDGQKAWQQDSKKRKATDQLTSNNKKQKRDKARQSLQSTLKMGQTKEKVEKLSLEDLC